VLSQGATFDGSVWREIVAASLEMQQKRRSWWGFCKSRVPSARPMGLGIFACAKGAGDLEGRPGGVSPRTSFGEGVA